VNEFQKRLMLVVAVLAVVATVDAVFANPKALQASPGGGHQIEDLQPTHRH
jgi:hypothetical protein